jgi:hypothetical protein
LIVVLGTSFLGVLRLLLRGAQLDFLMQNSPFHE